MLLPLLHRHMHDRVQDFLQVTLCRPLRKAYKNKRPVRSSPPTFGPLSLHLLFNLC
jgi:hypothetical protein